MNFITVLSKTSLVSIIASCVTYLSYFYLASNAMSKDFGIFTYYQSLMLLFINIIPFGSTMAVVVFRYSLTEYDYAQLIKEKIFILMPLTFLITASVAIVLSFMSIIIIDYDILISLLLICFFNSISLTIMGYYRVSQLFLRYGGVFLIYTFINSLLLVFSYFYFYSLNKAFYVVAIFSGIFSFYSIYSFKKQLGVSWRIDNIKNNFFSSFNYGYPVVLSSLTMSFLVVGDKLILGHISPELLTSYSIAALISSTTLFLVNNFASAWASYLVKKCDVDTGQLLLFYKKNLGKLFIVFPIGIFVILAQAVLYLTYYESTYPDLFKLIIMLTTAYLLLGVSKFFMGYMNYFKKNLAVFYSSLIAVFVIFSVVFFTGGEGMALSILIGMFFQLTFCVVYTHKLLRSL